MTTSNVILIGGPETGKTNFIARLWLALQDDDSMLKASGMAENIAYIEGAVEHLHQGKFAPRTDKNQDANSGSTIIPINIEGIDIANLVIPDVTGEVWEKAVEKNELGAEWMEQLESAIGCLLFLRALSPLNVSPLDWVNAGELMKIQSEDTQETELPTQVMLCELLRFIQLKLSSNNSNNPKPRIAVVITAWDRLDQTTSAIGPSAYLENEYPLFFGWLRDMDKFDVSIFAMSILGGDPEKDENFRNTLLESDFKSGYVMFERDGIVTEDTDISLPLSWIIGLRESL